ncbi:hypothetical protein F5Y19DRAFT_300618 [Xylariaceae sp. FL1651]|nr:hypothetical protein F5Y19DRAFT_300618 [Xylariaceae sp. FL1651]
MPNEPAIATCAKTFPTTTDEQMCGDLELGHSDVLENRKVNTVRDFGRARVRKNPIGSQRSNTHFPMFWNMDDVSFPLSPPFSRAKPSLVNGKGCGSESVNQEKLVAGARGSLLVVGRKCTEVDGVPLPQRDTTLNNEQWQALLALHRALLHEHYDFLLASQYPSTNLALLRQPSKYAMQARMWRHDIHSHLVPSGYCVPGCIDYVFILIYLVYMLMALLYETMLAFEDTWIECLDDLGGCGGVWTSVSRYWYSKTPTTEQFCYHLDILAGWQYVETDCNVASPVASFPVELSRHKGTDDELRVMFDTNLGRVPGDIWQSNIGPQ